MAEPLALVEGKLLLTCGACGQKNAVPPAGLRSGPVCGRCHADLAPPDRPLELDDAGLERLLAESALPVLVDFWGPQCGPCRMLAPILESFARKARGRALIAKVDTSRHTRAAVRLGVSSIPCLILFQRGQELRRQLGLVPERVLEGMLACALPA
ncbi:MAG TPA: thioredoxin domain-containing protein [Myxococcota bacterium]|nr:thioredoxin domain-containing protein [Myxococcota bacterium]HRY94640.1 thioredoxin domain-containing protein [Myxococcota bacterium]HSA23057.1 thioredoxin domain-containing protein [Myxococcota bacterium]